MDLKEKIIRFLKEESELYRCTERGDCYAVGVENKEDNEYLADELMKLFSLHNVIRSFKSDSKCNHDKTLSVIHDSIKTNRDYWLFTELFCLLHNNSDVCNCG